MTTILAEVTFEETKVGGAAPECGFYKPGRPLDCECPCPFPAVSRWRAVCVSHAERLVWACAIHEAIILASGEFSQCNDGAPIFWMPM